MGVMGLESSSSGRWGPPQPISLPGSQREYQTVDYHKNNLRNLRKASKQNATDGEDGRRSRPMRALPPDPRTLIEANKKRYEHVQSKVSAWASTTSIPDSLDSVTQSPKKVRSNFLRSHAKTGPFLPPSRLIARDGDIDLGDKDVASEIKPLNEAKYSKSMRNISYGDSATLPRGFKGRIHANIPPLSLGSGGEENANYTGDEEDNCDEEDMSIPFGGTAAGAAEYRGHSAKSGNSSFSRFSEITIEERKDRISAMITEIYTTVPMSRAHYGQGGRSLHDSMKKYASMDHVSDVGSIITTGATAIPARMVNGNVPLPHGGGAMGSARPVMSPSLHRRFVSSPKLTQSIVASKNPYHQSPPSSANKSSRSSIQGGGKGPMGKISPKVSSASSASNYIRKEQRQKAELYGTLPKRKSQSQSGKQGRELPKTPTDKKPSLPKLTKPEKRISRTNSPVKKVSTSSIKSNEEVSPELEKDINNVEHEAKEVAENHKEDNVSAAPSRKASTVVDLDNVPVPASLSRQGDSRSTSPGAQMDRDSLSPEPPKGYYKFTHEKDVVVNHTGKVFEHMDIVRHGHAAFFSIHKTNPFEDTSSTQKQDKDENFNNIQAEAEKIVNTIEHSREKTPSVINASRKSESRATSVANEIDNVQNVSRSTSVAENNSIRQSRSPSTAHQESPAQSRTTSVAESRRSQTPQRSRNISQVSTVSDIASVKDSQSRAASRRSDQSPMRTQGENRRSATPSSQRFISPSRSIELREDDGASVIKGVDIDYVSANADLVEQAGHQLRKASKERKESESRSSKLSGLADPVPQDHEKGTVPRYLQERREKWKREAEEAEKKRKESEGCPDGHVKLSDAERRVALHKMKDEYRNICAEMARFPIRSDTLRVRQKRIELEKELTRLEEDISKYEKEKVYIMKENNNAVTIESSVVPVVKQDFEPTLG